MPYKSKALRNAHERERRARDPNYLDSIRRYKTKWAREHRKTSTYRTVTLVKQREYDRKRSLTLKRREWKATYGKKYYHNNRTEILSYYREQYRTDPKLRERKLKYAKEWPKKNPTKYLQSSRLRTQRRLARIRNAEGEPFSRKDWISKVESLQWKCFHCGKRLIAKTLEMDHFIPISKGGLHQLDNLVPSCHRCNASKGNKLL